MKIWEGQCSSSDLLNLSSRQYYRFSGSDYKEVHTFYGEKNCVGEAIDITYKGEMTIKEAMVINDGAAAKARKVDFRFDHVEVTALNPAGKAALEKVGFCGVKFWEAGKPVVLDGKTGGIACPLRTVPTGEYNVFALENETLFLGKTGLSGGATKESARPTSIERAVPFVKSERKIGG